MDSPSPDIRTSVVTVSFGSGEQLRNMLGSLPPGTPTVIVNNDPEDSLDILDTIEGRDHRTLIHNQTNAGFGAACNIGAGQTGTEFLLFLNPDAQLEPDCIQALEVAADAHRGAVAFNPAMKNDRGKPLFKRSSVLLPRNRHLPRGWPPETRTVPVLNGAAFFVRKSAFDQVSGFDDRIFLYHEDDDLSIRLAENVGNLMFVREAEVIHQSGHSAPRSPEIAALKAYHMGRSRVYATRKHKLPFAGIRAVADACVQLFNPAVVLSARKRAKQIAFLKGVLSAAPIGAEL